MSTPSPEPSGLPLRALAMVLLSAAIVFAGLGFISMSGSGADAAASGSSSPTTAAQGGSGGAAQQTQSATTGRTAATGAAGSGGVTGSGTASESATAGAAATTTQSAATGAAGNVSDAQAQRTPVRVYNNSTVEGLAGDTAGTLESEGWSIAHVGNYNDGEVPRSAVYYGDGPGEKAAAQKVGAELGLPVEPRFAGIMSASPGVIVIVTADR